MKMFAAVLGLMLMLTAGAPFCVADDARPDAIHDVITRQLDAIKKDDADAAFAIASPTIQTMFGSPATFMSMVERGYPQIFRSIGHKFLNIDETDGLVRQRVLIESEKGSVIVRYEMIEIDGHWRINGCMIEKVDEA
jgi:Domain of unknown function (DUF4864)